MNKIGILSFEESDNESAYIFKKFIEYKAKKKLINKGDKNGNNTIQKTSRTSKRT